MTAARLTRRHNSRARRGMLSGMLLLGLGVVIGLVAVAFNIAHLRQVHSQLRMACEASALAGATELLDETRLYGVSDQEFDALSARVVAQTIAGQYSIAGRPLTLDLNVNNAPAGDIKIGYVAYPELINQPFMPVSNNATPCNAIVVTAARHAARGNPVALWLGGMFGSPTADVSCEARAVLDRRIIGFRPKGSTAAPIAPCLLDAQAWIAQRSQTPTQWTDRFSINQQTNVHSIGPDGIVELEFRCPIGGSAAPVVSTDGNPLAGQWALLPTGNHQSDWTTVDRQCAGGLTADDLAAYGGELVVPWGSQRLIEVLSSADPHHCDSLYAIRGQRRVWPLCATTATTQNSAAQNSSGNSQSSGLNRWTILDFTAGTVVDAYVDRSSNPNQVVIFVQPSLLATSAAVADPQASENNSIAKLQLTQ